MKKMPRKYKQTMKVKKINPSLFPYEPLIQRIYFIYLHFNIKHQRQFPTLCTNFTSKYIFLTKIWFGDHAINDY